MIPVNYRKRGKYWHISFSFQGQRFRYSTRASKREDAEYLSSLKIKSLIEQQAGAGDIALAELCGKYSRSVGLEKRSIKNDKGQIREIVRFFGPDTKLSIIQAFDVQRFKAHISNGRSPATVNRYLALLKRLFNLAIQWDLYRFRNPVSLVKFNRESPRLRFYSADEIKALLLAARQISERAENRIQYYFFYILATAIFTGMRLGEILALQWDDYASGFFTIQKSKSGRKRQVPVNGDLLKLLQTLPKDNDRVFPVRNTPDVIRDTWASCKASAHVSGRFHDCRHTFGSLAIQGGVDVATVKEILGHHSLAMTQIYIHSNQDQKKLAGESVAKIVPMGNR